MLAFRTLVIYLGEWSEVTERLCMTYLSEEGMLGLC